MVEAVRGGASAVLAASIFHYGHSTVGSIKTDMAAAGVPLRPALVSATGPTANRSLQPVIPCIDLMGGHAVQLVGGKPEALQIDAGDPLAVARSYAVGGELAVVDLDAAISGGSKNNRAIMEELVRMVPCRVGGGIRDVETARRWLDAGARRVVIGSAATVEFLAQLPRERVVVALDCRDGIVVTHGWKTTTGLSVLTRLEELAPHAAHFLVTFVEREGLMQGVPLERVAEMTRLLAGRCRLTVAGGITTAAEVAALDALGVESQIGMAMYSGRLPVRSLSSSQWLFIGVPFCFLLVSRKHAACGCTLGRRPPVARWLVAHRGMRSVQPRPWLVLQQRRVLPARHCNAARCVLVPLAQCALDQRRDERRHTGAAARHARL